MIEVLCYALLAAAWIVDLVTPQLFVAAILLNGPIALSSLALRPALTVRLMLLAEIANVIAGYVNGVQAGHHWDTIAIGDRALSAASFILVGFLTMRLQQTARAGGEVDERSRRMLRERELRVALERVRASLNVELVLRAAAREAQMLANAHTVRVFRRDTSMGNADTFVFEAGGDHVNYAREKMRPEYASLIEKARETRRAVSVDGRDPIGRLLDESLVCTAMRLPDAEVALMVAWRDCSPGADDVRTLEDFTSGVENALIQAQLFARLGEQHAEISRQKDASQARSDVIRDIVYALSHDLRTPLTASDLTMRQALDGVYGDLPAPYKRVVEASIVSNDELRRLVESLLLVARYESGEDSRAMAPERVGELARRACDDVRAVAENKGVILQYSIDADATVDVDAREVRRALTNLIANAIDASSPGDRIDVRVGCNGQVARVDVIDNGFGVPADRRAALFERFGGVRAGAGTGLGLYIVRRIAEKYGGRALFFPREPNGSHFAIELPIGKAA